MFPVRLIRGWFSEYKISSIPSLDIEVTNICNSKCVFCANKIMRRPSQHLDMQLFEKVVNEFVAMRGVNISFCTCIGEPLLDPYLLERIRYIRRFPQLMFEGFFTTLQWLHKFDIDEFFKLGISPLFISTMFLGREKYREFFGVDNYEQTLKNIIMLVQENKKRQNKIMLSFFLKNCGKSRKVIMNHPDFKLVDKLTDGYLFKCVQNIGFFVDDWCGAVKLPQYLRRRPLYPRLFKPCRFFCNILMIFSNGKIGLCPCRDFEANSDLILGDIKKDSLKELWGSGKHLILFNNWRRKNIIPTICRRCRHYPI